MSLKIQKDQNRKKQSLDSFKRELRSKPDDVLGAMKYNYGEQIGFGGPDKEERDAIRQEIKRRGTEYRKGELERVCRGTFGDSFKYVTDQPLTHSSSRFGDTEFRLEQVWHDLGQADKHVKSLKSDGRTVAVTASHLYDTTEYRVYATKAPDKMLKKSKKNEAVVDSVRLKKGDIFSTSWGYEQTNYDFIVITGFTESGKTAICRMSKANRVDEESGAGYDALVPTGEPYGDEFKMRVEVYTSHRGDKEVSLNGSYPYSDGEMQRAKRLDSFHRVKSDQIHHQTALGWGH